MHILILSSKWTHKSPKKPVVFCQENVPFKLNFQNEGHLYTNCLFFILSFRLKCLLFQFVSRGICVHIPIVAGFQNGRTSRQKISHILLNNFLFQALLSR